jgi:hypothetical protein
MPLFSILLSASFNLNVPGRSHGHPHCQDGGKETLHSVLLQLANGTHLHGAHARRHLQDHGKCTIMQNKNYQPTQQDVNLYNHILEFNSDGRVSLEDFEGLAVKYLARVEKKYKLSYTGITPRTYENDCRWPDDSSRSSTETKAVF